MTAAVDRLPALASQTARRTRLRLPRWAAALAQNPLTLTGVLIELGFIVIALAAPVLAPPANPVRPFEMPRTGYWPTPQPPSAHNPFGTTPGQFDIYYGVIWGSRLALEFGLAGAGVSAAIGGTVGAISGWAGGLVDEIIQRLVEVVMLVPWLVAALTLASILAPRIHDPLLSGTLAVLAFAWPGYTRLIRGDVLAVKERDYVLAARAVGATNRHILLRHILPNALHTILTVVWLDISSYVLALAGLSFLGIGTPPGYADWGQLLGYAPDWIADMGHYWYLVVFPGGALLLFVLGWNLIGDAVRDAFDPMTMGRYRG